MGHLCLHDRQHIAPYLRSMRAAQRRARLCGDEAIVDRLLEAQVVTIDSGDADHFSGANTPLKTWLSLLDDDGRRSRVLEVYVDRDRVGPDEVALLSEVLRGARMKLALLRV